MDTLHARKGLQQGHIDSPASGRIYRNLQGAEMTFYKPEDYSKVNTRHYLIDQYLDFKNNYLSPDLFAEHRGIDVEQAKALIDIGRDLFNTKHPEA